MVRVSEGVEDILGPACRRNCGDCDDEGEDPRFTAKYAYLLVHDAECFDLAYEAYDRTMMMVRIFFIFMVMMLFRIPTRTHRSQKVRR